MTSIDPTGTRIVGRTYLASWTHKSDSIASSNSKFDDNANVKEGRVQLGDERKLSSASSLLQYISKLQGWNSASRYTVKWVSKPFFVTQMMKDGGKAPCILQASFWHLFSQGASDRGRFTWDELQKSGGAFNLAIPSITFVEWQACRSCQAPCKEFQMKQSRPAKVRKSTLPASWETHSVSLRSTTSMPPPHLGAALAW